MESTPSLHASPETFEENGIECISFALLSHTHTHTHSHTHTRTFSLFRYLNAKKLRQERWFGKGKSNSRFYVIVNYFLFDISNGLFPFAPQYSKTFFQCVFDFCLFVCFSEWFKCLFERNDIPICYFPLRNCNPCGPLSTPVF